MKPPKKWTCDHSGTEHEGEAPIDNDYGDICMICCKESSPEPECGIPLVAIIVAVLGLTSLAGVLVWFFVFRQPCPDGQQPIRVGSAPPICPPSSSPSPAPTGNPSPQTSPTGNSPTPQPATLVQDRLSSGERRLLANRQNPDADRGVEAFSQANYDTAVDFFERAISGDRNDPEIQIYLNNAEARRSGQTPLKVAAVVPIDGAQNLAEEILRGVADAQTYFNSEIGGLSGRLLEVVIADDGNDLTLAPQIAQEISSDQEILAVIGHNSSEATEAALSTYIQARVPVISPTSTSNDLSGDIFFRTTPSDGQLGERLAEYASEIMGLDRVATFYDPDSAYSTSIESSFTNSFEGYSGIIVERIDLSAPAFDAEAEIFSIQNDAEGVALFPSSHQVSIAIQVARANSQLANPLLLLGGDTLYRETTLRQGSNVINNIVLSVPWFHEGFDGPSDYARRAESRWGGTVSWRTATSFDATMAFVNGLSSTPSRTSLIQELSRPSFLINTEETSGMTTLSFDAEGNRSDDPWLVEARTEDGRFGFYSAETVW